MHLGFVVYGGLDGTSGGYRYDRQLVDYCRDCGDTVDVISLPEGSYWRRAADGLDPTIARRLDRPVDVLLEDELCHPSLWRQHRRLDRPGAVAALVHHVASDRPSGRLLRLRRWIERQYLRSVDGAVCTSAFTRRRAARLAPGLADCPVAPPAGRTERTAATPEDVRRRAAEGPLRIAFVGNLVPRKDPLSLLEAVDRLDGWEQSPDWELTVVGSHTAAPAYAERVVEAATDRGLDDRVRFVGEVDDGALTDVLAASHVCCVPSTYEGFGMVYLEAMEHGVVPIASATGGAGEFVTDGGNGALVDPGDADRIAALLADWAADRDRLGDLGVAALETAAAHPSWAETLSAVRTYLQRLASDATPDPQAATPQEGRS
ncbi:glycosyltransferase family 4 protein [Halohasta salina]|uniref:glycosyltransferase family 4 protein n=1 Tax=Halohasta salina TaxID=2961621 RepID=UPI0020A569E6|nr:glycosyltransferase family 4 protein [Halohasta salina]